jgi:16S rRNA (guanine527-N7)-methyltransferase
LRDERLDRWLAALVETPGLTAVSDLTEARRLHLDGALVAEPLLEGGPVIDVGSGGGSPGLPLAAVRPDLRFDLLESVRKKCVFLSSWSDELRNVAVVCARAEEHARGPGREAYGTALARALAPPPVAAEWCLPLLRAGGRAILFAGPTADEAAVEAAAQQVGGELESAQPGFLLLRKTGPTPDAFPRRLGLARKRPLA